MSHSWSKAKEPTFSFFIHLGGGQLVDCLSRMLLKGINTNIIDGFSIRNSSLTINHLQFADDTILFSSPNVEKLNRLFEIIQSFEMASGLGINHSKSEFLGINIDSSIVQSLAVAFGCKVGTWPSSYLGLPLHGKPFTTSFWDPIIEKIERQSKKLVPISLRVVVSH